MVNSKEHAMKWAVDKAAILERNKDLSHSQLKFNVESDEILEVLSNMPENLSRTDAKS